MGRPAIQRTPFTSLLICCATCCWRCHEGWELLQRKAAPGTGDATSRFGLWLLQEQEQKLAEAKERAALYEQKHVNAVKRVDQLKVNFFAGVLHRKLPA